MTASPYFGSRSRIVWPPASMPPASRTFPAAASNTAASAGFGKSSGNPAIESANSTRPPIANTSDSAFASGDLPVRDRVVDEQQEEVERAEDCEVVRDAVRGGVIGRLEAGDEGRIPVRARAQAGEAHMARRSAPSFAAQPPHSVSSVSRIGGGSSRRVAVVIGR